MLLAASHLLNNSNTGLASLVARRSLLVAGANLIKATMKKQVIPPPSVFASVAAGAKENGMVELEEVRRREERSDEL